MDNISLATDILNAAKTHEDSWDTKKQKYRISVGVAAELIAGKNNPTNTLISLLLSNCWNDSLDWANEIINSQ